MSLLYLDNNILNKCFKMTKKEYSNVMNPVFTFGVGWKSSYQHMGTYFGVLEAIGIRTTFLNDLRCDEGLVEKIRHYRSINDGVSVSKYTKELVELLLLSYQKALRNSSELSRENLIKYFDEQRSHCTNGLWLYDDVVGKEFVKLEDYIEGMIEWLSFDRIYSQKYKSIIQHDCYTYLMSESIHFLSNKRANSFAKFFFNLGKELVRDITKSDCQAIAKAKETIGKINAAGNMRKSKRRGQLNKMIKSHDTRLELATKVYDLSNYGHSRDNVDSEMVHLLLFGSYNPKEKKNIPVNVVSSDKIETILARISLYKSFTKETYSFKKEGEIQLSEGRFFFYDKDKNEITSYLKIEDVVDYFSIDRKRKSFDQIKKKCIVHL